MSNKPQSPESKLQELIGKYYLWREENKGEGVEGIHAKCEELNIYWALWVKKRYKTDKAGKELQEPRFRHYMNTLTNCYTIVRQRKEIEELKKELKRSLKNRGAGRSDT